jgi:hypothetical protein
MPRMTGFGGNRDYGMKSGRFRFRLFEFDVAKGELRREGVLRRLQS